MRTTNRWVVLGICCLSLFIVGIDTTGLNLALPSIQRDLEASYAQLQWVIDAYSVVLAGLLMLAGSSGDRWGRRRVFQTGLLLFGTGSLLCSLAPGIEVLIAARAVQAVGGSMLNPVAMSIITNTFHDARERAQAIGVWGATVGLSMALGPVVGGALVDASGWRAIFWLNIPVVLVALILTALFVPESRAPHVRRFDPVGQISVIVLLSSLIFGIIEGHGRGWTSAVVLGCFLVAIVAGTVLARYERRRAEPLLDPRLFASVPFTGAVLAAIVGYSAFGGFLFLNTLYLQDVRGLSPFDAGLMTLPMALTVAVISPISGRLVGSYGPRPSLLVTAIAFTLSGAVLLSTDASTPYAVLVLAYVSFGAGFGMLNPPITNTAVSGLPRAQAGVAAAVASMSRQVGSSLGVAIYGAVVSTRMVGPVETGLPDASRLGWWLMIAVGIAMGVLAVWTTTDQARRTSEQVAAAITS